MDKNFIIIVLPSFLNQDIHLIEDTIHYSFIVVDIDLRIAFIVRDTYLINFVDNLLINFVDNHHLMDKVMEIRN